MELTGLSLATVVLFLPLVGMTILLFMRENQTRNMQLVALGTTIVTFLASLVLWAQFDPNNPSLQFVQQAAWIPSLGISYYVGVDGVSLFLIILTTFIMAIAVLISWRAHVLEERGRQKLYYVFLLLLEWAMIGVFVAQDLILFYVFWEVTLVPMYFLIGIWGSEQRVYAAVKFFLYTMAGSLLMLLAILYLGAQAGTFATPDIMAMMQSGELNIPLAGVFSTQSLLFLGFFIAFAIKVPIWPFHSWLPDAHVQAPTAASVVLAGVLLKMGSYGMIRFNLQLFPDASVQWAPYHRGAGGHWHHLRRVGCLRANGHEEAGGLHVRQPHGLHCPGDFRGVGGKYSGQRIADGQPRHQHGRLVPARRHAV